MNKADLQNAKDWTLAIGFMVLVALGAILTFTLIIGGVLTMSEAGENATQVWQGFAALTSGFVLLGVLAHIVPLPNRYHSR